MCGYWNVRQQFLYILRFEHFVKSLLLVTPWAMFSAWNKFAIVNTIIQSVVSFYWDCHTIVDYTQRTLTHFKENRCRKCLHKGKIIGVCLFINWEPPQLQCFVGDMTLMMQPFQLFFLRRRDTHLANFSASI